MDWLVRKKEESSLEKVETNIFKSLIKIIVASLNHPSARSGG